MLSVRSKHALETAIPNKLDQMNVVKSLEVVDLLFEHGKSLFILYTGTGTVNSFALLSVAISESPPSLFHMSCDLLHIPEMTNCS